MNVQKRRDIMRFNHEPMKNPTGYAKFLLSWGLISLLFMSSQPISSIAGQRLDGESGVLAQDRPFGSTARFLDQRSVQPTDLVEVMIELEEPPTIEVYAQAQRGVSAFEARRVQTAQAHLARIEQAQTELVDALAAPEIQATVLSRVQRVYNGIAVQVEAGKLDEIRKLRGVKAIHSETLLYPQSNAAVPFIGTPTAWTTDMGVRGEGIKIGIIDRGIDYLHRNFGGPGTGYASNDRTIVGDAPNFPGVKIAGGFDFVGDDYDASSPDPAKRVPHPDLDPMDCRGHGTAVASLAAGLGVNADGSTYTGPYDASTPFSSLKIGPGAAPAATLYALKVFGCADKSRVAHSVVAQAIDWAVDPNGDGNFSDHLDVINLSLGNSFFPADSAVVAADNAALAGVIVVAGAGNSGDTFYITGGPSVAVRAISVAGSVDTGIIVPALRINSPAHLAGLHEIGTAKFGPPLERDPGITGDVVATTPTDGCAALTNRAAVRGKIALIDRGTCRFIAKVRNAQAAGAVAAIIVNNVAGPPPGMADDGTGSDITIPSVMISQASGDSIKRFLSTGVNVTLSSSTVIPRPELADTLYSFTSRGPSAAGLALKPDITAPGVAMTAALAGTGTEAESFSGTSLATPLVAGGMALLRQLHPDWSVEQLKALVMNTATFDLFSGPNSMPLRYGLSRVGAGRIALQNASAASVIAYNADDAGAVSVSFGAPEIVGTATLTKMVRVVNKGSSPVSYALGYTNLTDVPGVSYSFPPSVSVPPNGMTTFTVQLTATASQMKHTHDPTISETQVGFPRHWLSEESGYITLTPDLGPALRVPLYAAPRPASRMGTRQSSLSLAAATGRITLDLIGQDVNTGSAYPTDEISLVAPFELQEISPNEPTSNGLSDMADLKSVGVSSNVKAAGSSADMEIRFAIAAHGNWSSPALPVFSIFIDVNRDGRDDFELYEGVALTPQGDFTDVFVSVLHNLTTGATQSEFFLNSLSAEQFDTVPYNTNVLSLAVRAADLGLTDADAKFTYQVKTFYDGMPMDTSSRLTYDAAHPGLDFGGFVAYFDTDGETIPVQYNRADFQAAGSRGVLLLHHHNTTGARDQVLLVSASTGKR
jgi:hypothetical protein